MRGLMFKKVRHGRKWNRRPCVFGTFGWHVAQSAFELRLKLGLRIVTAG
jgi:hypothetical protein